MIGAETRLLWIAFNEILQDAPRQTEDQKMLNAVAILPK